MAVAPSRFFAPVVQLAAKMAKKLNFHIIICGVMFFYIILHPILQKGRATHRPHTPQKSRANNYNRKKTYIRYAS